MTAPAVPPGARAAAVTALCCAPVLALAGCGAGEDDGAAAGEDTVVRMMTWEGAETNAAIDAALEGFDVPGVTVERVDAPSGGYSEQLASLTQAQELPDLFWCGNDTALQYTNEGLLVDWSDRLADPSSGLGAGDFVPSAIENWTTPDGRIGGIPSLMNTYGVWYDAGAFEAAGLPLPAEGWTWDDMFAAAAALADPAADRYGLVADQLVGDDGPFTMSVYSLSAGGQAFADSVNTPTEIAADAAYAEGVGKLAAAVQSGAVAPPGYDASDAQSLFASGSLPMLFGGQWLASGFLVDEPDIDYGFAPLPVQDTPATLFDAVGVCTPSYAEDPDAVWEVLRYLNESVWAPVLAESPVAPPAYTAAQDDYFQVLEDAGLTSVADTVRVGLDTTPTTGVRFTTTWSAEARDIATTYWPGILTGERPVTDLDAMAADIDALAGAPG
jgi:ABC-type glycerol-3-phosphate transport system substrate-binding protein